MGILVLTAALAEGDEEKDMSSIVVLIKRIACPWTRACYLNAGGGRFAACNDCSFKAEAAHATKETEPEQYSTNGDKDPPLSQRGSVQEIGS